MGEKLATMQVYKKGLFIFSVFMLIVNLLLSFVSVFLLNSPVKLVYGLAYSVVVAGGIVALRWFLRKDLDWASTTLGALGIVVLTILIVTGTDFLFPHQFDK